MNMNGDLTILGNTGALPRGATVGGDGNIWYASESGKSIGRFQIAGPERVTNQTFEVAAAASRSAALGVSSRADKAFESLEEDQSRVIDGSLTVTGKANLYDLAVTNSINAGLLTISGLTDTGGSAIDTLAGKLLLQFQAQGVIEMMGGRVVVDKQGNITLKGGVIIGNKDFAGRITIPKGLKEIRVTRNWTHSPLLIVVTPDRIIGSWAITELSTSGFTVEIEKELSEDLQMYWIGVFEDFAKELQFLRRPRYNL